MKKCKQYILMATAAAMLLAVGCRTEEVDNNKTDTGKLQFRPNLDKAHTATRASESDNNVLKTASAAGINPPHIVIETYTGTPGSSLKPYFSDALGYFKSGSYWDVNSGTPRFLPSDGMNLYAYFATDCIGKGSLANLNYIPPTTEASHPTLTFKVPTNEALNQVDLIAAKVEGITRSEVLIPFQHILSQINFGVKGMDQHQITIKNIRINKVIGNGSFNYNTWQWTPDSETISYPYYFPDRKEGNTKSGLGENYKTTGALNDSQNNYIFGDGGKFGPGNEATFLYAQTNPATTNYATQDNTPTPLHNSLILLPQEITKNADATVTLDYEIRLNDLIVRSDLNYTIHLDTYYDWMPNLRYVYLFKFDDPEKVTFEVLAEPWQNYNGTDGIVGTEEINSTNLFLKYIRPIKTGENYSVPIGTLSANFICDWSQYTLDNSFTLGQTFTLSFDNLNASSLNGKSVIINPPFGFKAEPSSLNAPGKVTFTPIKSYYATSAALNSAISSGFGNHEFYVSDAVKLEEINFKGSTTAESSLTLHSLNSYNEASFPDWQFFDGKAVYYPNEYALTNSAAPYSYTAYTVNGLKKVFDWMNNGGINPGGNNSTLTLPERMKTNITLAANGKYDLAKVYKANASDSKPSFVSIGDNNTPYTGYFDGNCATVENLYINSTGSFQGFFGDKRGNIDNLNLVNVSVASSSGNFIGGIAGYNGGGNIRNCSVSGSVSGSWTIGGIAGSNGSYIIGCRSSATVYSSTSGDEVGGICGKEGWINACYSTGKVTGTGGISGKGGTISSSYYVASSDIGSNNPKGTRLPSIAALNGKIGEFNGVLNSSYIENFKYVSGDLNSTPPSTVVGYPNRANGGVLKGTFIQNWFALGWDETKWDTEMALLATLGMKYLVIDQVMESNGAEYIAWYPASQSVLANDPSGKINWGTALEKCMNACRAHDIKLFIGTFFDKRYWNDGKAVTNSTEWNNCIATANNVMDELISKYFHNGANNYNDVLAGWYFPYEIDDFNFQTANAQNILKTGIQSAMLHRNNHSNPNANKPYLFSPFMNGSGKDAIGGAMNTTTYAALWKDIISTTGFRTGDILSPQDCIGIGKLTIADLAIWMPALKGATTNGVEFWINVELFGPGGNTSFLTTQQIPASKSYAAQLISFSYPIHYSPNSGEKQGDHNAYKNYYDAQ